VAGWSNPIQFGQNYVYATIKYNSAGVQQWVARYNGPDNSQDRAVSLAVDGQGNVYVTGESYSTATTYDFATIKYNAAGVQQWVRTYSGPAGSVFFDQARSLAMDGQGNVYVTGLSDSVGPDYLTIKYNPSGAEQWVARYNSFNGQVNSNDDPSSIAVDAHGNVYVTGYSQTTGQLLQYATVKYNSSGIQEWVQLYVGSDTLGVYQHIANAIAVDSFGNVHVTGVSQGNGTPDYATVKYGPTGDEEWAVVYNGPGNSQDNSRAIALDAQGNVYVTGESWGSGTGLDCSTIKYNSSGVLQWLARYDGPGNVNDYANAIAVDAQGGVYITGQSNQGQTGLNFDYVTIKYSQPTGVPEASSLLPERVALFQNYPNPFNPGTKIGFEIATFGLVSLKVYDPLGSEVATLVNEELRPGIYERVFDGENLASGVYFYRLMTNSFVQTRKLVLMK
jgi:uncharacterized delta-60 repeat protein